MLIAAVTFSLGVYLASADCRIYANTNLLLDAHHSTWLPAAGISHNWPTITNEDACQASCLADHRCVAFVFHGNACAPCVDGGWVHKCVTWHSSDLIVTGRQSATTWPRQTGVVSGSCQNARYHYSPTGCDRVGVPGEWIPISTAAECGIAAEQRGEVGGCRQGNCPPIANSDIRPHGCYGANNAIYHFNPGTGCAGGTCGPWGQLCKQIGMTASTPEVYRIMHTGCASGWIPINSPAECGIAATESGVDKGCRAGSCASIVPSTTRPKGCYGANEHYYFNAGGGCVGGSCSGLGQLCKRETFRFYIQGCPNGWEPLTNAEECGMATQSIGNPGSCNVGSCPTATNTAVKPAGCYGSMAKVFNFNANDGCQGGACGGYGQVCKPATCTVYENRSAIYGKISDYNIWPFYYYEGACRDHCERDPLCAVYTYVSAAHFSGPWHGKCITLHAGDLQDWGRQATTSWPRQANVNTASCRHTTSGLWRGGSLDDDTEGAVSVFESHSDTLSRNTPVLPVSPPDLPRGEPAPGNQPVYQPGGQPVYQPAGYQPGYQPGYQNAPNSMYPPQSPYGTPHYGTYDNESKDDDNDSWKGWVIAVTAINIVAIVGIAIAVSVYFCYCKK